MREIVQLAITAPPAIGARAAATLADLLASAGIDVGRTGSVVLDWPAAALPFDAEAWEQPRPVDADPVAFAHRHLTSRGESGGFDHPVDEVRRRVAEWARSERLAIAATWPGGCTCAVALIHDARPFDPPRHGLLGRLRRGATVDASAVYAQVAQIERTHSAHSSLRSVDLLSPEQQAETRGMGFALSSASGVRIASRAGFRLGTAFPSRGYDSDADRPTDWVEIPRLEEGAEMGFRALLEAGGAAALSVPIEDFAGVTGTERLADYDALLGRMRALGAWLATPEAIVQRLYGT